MCLTDIIMTFNYLKKRIIYCSYDLDESFKINVMVHALILKLLYFDLTSIKH